MAVSYVWTSLSASDLETMFICRFSIGLLPIFLLRTTPLRRWTNLKHGVVSWPFASGTRRRRFHGVMSSVSWR
jgi:hypothetical protein